jgi:hypothetical protein
MVLRNAWTIGSLVEKYISDAKCAEQKSSHKSIISVQFLARLRVSPENKRRSKT